VDLLQHLATFVRIADAGSISQAARGLRLSVAMTSRHLSALEDELGVPLMRRTTRRLTLTDAGTELLVRARSLLAAADETREVLRPGRGAAGVVVVSLPVSFGLGRIAPLFPDLLARHPRLKLDMRFEDRAVDLLADGIDLAIRAGITPPDSPFVIARRITTVERYVCAAPAFVAKHGRPATVASLASLPCVVQGTGPARWHYETERGAETVVVDGRLRTNNVIALRAAAVAGAGIAQLPRWIVEDDLRKKRLVRLLPDAKLPIIEVFGLYHRDSRGSAAIRAVVDHFAEHLPARMRS
jgi:DNA-binding transcriptional LysR family regulator